jgi:hypothetical protein
VNEIKFKYGSFYSAFVIFLSGAEDFKLKRGGFHSCDLHGDDCIKLNPGFESSRILEYNMGLSELNGFPLWHFLSYIRSGKKFGLSSFY